MPTTRNRVFVAGATGYLGGFLTMEFGKRGHRVDALSRSTSGAKRLADTGVTPVVAEATDPPRSMVSSQGSTLSSVLWERRVRKTEPPTNRSTIKPT